MNKKTFFLFPLFTSFHPFSPLFTNFKFISIMDQSEQEVDSNVEFDISSPLRHIINLHKNNRAILLIYVGFLLAIGPGGTELLWSGNCWSTLSAEVVAFSLLSVLTSYLRLNNNHQV